MLKITEDISQWKTMTNLVGWVNTNNVDLYPHILDIGANNGKDLSNSYSLITENSWLGTLVEPNKDVFDQIILNYVGFESKITLINKGISNKNGISNLHLVNNDPMLGSVEVNSGRQITIDIISFIELSHLIDNNIGIMSIDTEGHDNTILSSMFFDTTIRPKIIITESWNAETDKATAKNDMMTKFGYNRFLKIAENEMFINNVGQ